jgi:hypothetical protein
LGGGATERNGGPGGGAKPQRRGVALRLLAWTTCPIQARRKDFSMLQLRRPENRATPVEVARLVGPVMRSREPQLNRESDEARHVWSAWRVV